MEDNKNVVKSEHSKIFFGCGGCGCLLAIIAFFAGVFMIAMGNDSHLSELGPFGLIVTPLACFIGVIGLVLLVVGFVMKKKNNGVDIEDK